MRKFINCTKKSLYVLTIATGLSALIISCQNAELIAPQNEESLASQSESIIGNTNAFKNNAAGASASGQGTLTFDGIPIEGEGFRHFTFHARVKANGEVQGSGTLTYTGGVRNTRFDIDCLTVDGNHAIISGVTTRDNQFPENEGVLFWFEVFDNGEGSNADPDQMSLYYQGTNPDVYNCANDFDVPIYQIEGGNIQVRE